MTRRPLAAGALAAALTQAAAPVAADLPAGVAPNVVLVHGAVLDGSTWRAVHDLLVADGLRVTVAQLPLSGLMDDVAAVRAVLDRQDGPVTLVGHSYGGAVISVAGADPDVASLVYVAALQPDAGESVADLNASMPSPARDGDTVLTADGAALTVDPDRFAAALAADLPAADARFLADSQTPTAVSAFSAALPEAAWHDRPVYGIVAARDRSVNPDLQRWMYERSGAAVVELDASHLVPMSRPDAVADVIREVAGF